MSRNASFLHNNSSDLTLSLANVQNQQITGNKYEHSNNKRDIYYLISI
jgi:hypothetical protein